MGIDDKVKGSEDAFKKDESEPSIPGKEWYEKPCDACGDVIKEDGMTATNEKGMRLNYHSSCFNKYFTNKSKSEDRS